MKVGIIGKGNVGSALQRGLQGNGHEVKICGNDPQKVAEIAGWGDVTVLAVPFEARKDVAAKIKDKVRGKPVVDATNAVSSSGAFEADPKRSSSVEELQQLMPGAKLVKAFNTVFAENMPKGVVKGEPLTLFVAGDDEAAKAKVRDMGRDLGFDPVDAGPLRNARWMETLGYFNIQLGRGQAMGTDIGFRLVH